LSHALALQTKKVLEFSDSSYHLTKLSAFPSGAFPSMSPRFPGFYVGPQAENV